MTDILAIPGDILSGGSQQPEQQPETEAPEPDPSMAGALSDDSATTVLPPSFGQKVAQSANDLAEQQTPQQAARPSSWARTLVGGVMDALSGFVAGGGAGQAAAKNQQELLARNDRLKQQAIENRQKQQQMSREEAIARATIAHENAATVYDEMNAATLSYKNQALGVETGKSMLKPYIDAGTPILAEGLDNVAANNLIREKKLSPTQQHGFPTGQVPVLGPDGEPLTDKAGNPVMRNTYTVIGDVPKITFDEANSKLVSENTPYKIPPGSTMSGIVGGTILQNAKSTQTARMLADEQLEKAGIEKTKTDIDRDALAFAPTWNRAMAKAGQNVRAALTHVETDKDISQRYPNAAALVANIYGGQKNLDEVEDQQETERQKQQELNDKEATKDDWTGNPKAQTPQEFISSLSPEQQDILKDIHSGQIVPERLSYLLARNPGIIEALAKGYPDIDTTKLQGYPKLYNEFHSGDIAKQLANGGTVLKHLKELNDARSITSHIGTNAFGIGGLDARQKYQTALNQVAGELGQFYKENNIPNAERVIDALGSTFGRGGGIKEASHLVGEKIDEWQDLWDRGAPSDVYKPKFPDVSAEAKRARAALDPTYATQVNAKPTPQTHVFDPQAWAKANPNGDVNAAIEAAKAQGYAIKANP